MLLEGSDLSHRAVLDLSRELKAATQGRVLCGCATQAEATVCKLICATIPRRQKELRVPTVHLNAGESKPAAGGTHTLDAQRMINKDALPFQPLGSQQYIPRQAAQWPDVCIHLDITLEQHMC